MKSRTSEHHPTVGQLLLYDLLASALILAEDWEHLSTEVQKQVLQSPTKDQALDLLVQNGLLTMYQAARIIAGTTFGLVLGNYRVLERIGAGGMAVVFKGEHIDLRHQVAIKVLPLTLGQDDRLLSRFFAEMRIVARLRHPNIVAAIDAGKAVSNDPDAPELRYFVMEYVPGQDLEEYVLSRGPLSPAKACNVAHQIACALAETYKFNLVHRDIKPSNVLLTSEEQAKLLDFGLMRDVGTRLTQPGTVLGTLDFMAPEQAQDATTVDVRADLYGLGGTLFWCLTGKLPFPSNGSLTGGLIRRLSQPPPSVRHLAPDVPAGLDALVARLMAIRPEDRFQTPQEVMRALLGFLKPESREHARLHGSQTEPSFNLDGESACQQLLARYGSTPENPSSSCFAGSSVQSSHRILIVDDEKGLRDFCKGILEAEGLRCDQAGNGDTALEMAAATPYDLAMVDVNMPGMSGIEVLQRLRRSPPCPHLKIVMFSGATSPDEMAEMLLAGADDYLTKPFSVVQLQGRIQSALRLKDAQDRSASLNHQLLTINAELERNLTARNSDLVEARNALVLALAKLVEHRDGDVSKHTLRMQRYCRCLAERAARVTPYDTQIDDSFIEMLTCCAPLHDVGKVGLPDHILMKPGKLTSEERILMQAHTVIGADTLGQVAKEHGFALAFLRMAVDITRHHHERWDGSGYPDRLAGTDIPLAARIVALCDVYDALRSRRIYKPALAHAATVQIMSEVSPGHFDPALVQVFQSCAAEFDRIFLELKD